MKAFRIVEAGKCEIVALPVPAPQPGDVLLKVCRVGFCGSDLNTYLGRNPMVTYPRIPGHEIAATIDSVTVGVPDNIKPGMPVTVVPYTNCGVCSACRRGRPHACRSNQTLGVQRDGALTEYITVPWQKLVLAPALSLAQLTVVEPLTVGFHAVSRGSVAAGDVVAVFGCGMIGMGAVAGAAMRGAKVFNLCRSYRYQSLGYYVSLLAAARGHRPLPGVTAMQDLKSHHIIRHVSDELDRLIQVERPRVAASPHEGDTKRQLQVLDQRIGYLQQSLHSAEVVPPNGMSRWV